MWQVLASALREIHTKNASALSFEELYRNAYKLVLKKKGEALYIRVKEFEEAWLAREVRSKIRDSITASFLTGPSGGLASTANERRVAGERFLRGLKQAWEDHNTCACMITDVLMYMVSFWSLLNAWPVCSTKISSRHYISFLTGKLWCRKISQLPMNT